jgi:hypothetical protein
MFPDRNSSRLNAAALSSLATALAYPIRTGALCRLRGLNCLLQRAWTILSLQAGVTSTTGGVNENET